MYSFHRCFAKYHPIILMIRPRNNDIPIPTKPPSHPPARPNIVELMVLTRNCIFNQLRLLPGRIYFIASP